MNRINISLLLVMLLLVQSCRKEEDSPQVRSASPSMPAQAMPAPHVGVIKEVLQASEYTYLNLEEEGQTYWIAIRKVDLPVGETVSFRGGLEMKDFVSKDLERTFSSVLFVDQVTSGETAAVPPTMSASPHQTPMASGKPTLARQEVTVEPLAGGVSIGELFAQRQTYAGQIVTVKGQVTKVNRGIMGKNWIHLQDGTEGDGEFDLTLTTQDDAQVGDIAVFAGTLALDRDFGAGYKYDVIVENAQRVAD